MFVESIKSKIKLKIAKFEKSLQVWNDFDKTSGDLNQMFETMTNVKSNIEV